MKRPNIGGHDALAGQTWEREMTEDEYADLIASGWTETPAQEATPE